MGKNKINSIIVHRPDDADLLALADRVNEFHVGLIERKLNQSSLTTEQKIAVIDQILRDLKARECAGIIK